MTDHDLLIRIDERLTKLVGDFERHLARHWAVTIMSLSAAASGITALVIVLAK